MDLAFLRRLMDTPSFFQGGLYILLEKEVPEDKLVLVYSFFGDDQGKGPLNIVF